MLSSFFATSWETFIGEISSRPRQARLFGLACYLEACRTWDINVDRKDIVKIERLADGVDRIFRRPRGYVSTGDLFDVNEDNFSLLLNQLLADHYLQYAWSTYTTCATLIAQKTPGERQWLTPLGSAENIKRKLQLLFGEEIFAKTRKLAVIPPIVKKIAESIYQNDLWQDIPLLGDALEEAEMPADLVAHCHDGQRHIRGCWVVDSLLWAD